MFLFLSTLSLRRATSALHNILELFPISIHALLAESDPARAFLISYILYFYPRSPCGERHLCFIQTPAVIVFLSTLSLRRATFNHLHGVGKLFHFYPRSPCGERPDGLFFLCTEKHFYPRSPCGERLDYCKSTISRNWNFYPRSPCGERRKPDSGRIRNTVISIHALLAESDITIEFLLRLPKNFYPRSPCGERPWQRGSRVTYVEISIHALLAESDPTATGNDKDNMISIHALLAESDTSALFSPLL